MTKPIFPPAVLSQHIAVLGKTGSGKTSTAKLAVEQIVADGSRVCVLDPIKSDWWGLTLAANGVDRGLPFQILGGPRGHIQLHSAAGKTVAEVVANGSLPLSIIDMADFEPGGQAKFFTDFAPTLLRKMKGVLYLVIEEAHLFAPKERSGIGKENVAIHWAKTLAQAGRSKGIRLIVLTQRTQALHNAILGSCDSLIAHRLTAPADQLPVLKWLQANADKATVKSVESSLSSVKTGEGWLCSGEAQVFERIKFPRMSTYDNTATPTDEDYREVTVPAVDVDALKALIGQAAAEAEENDPRRLKEENAKLKSELARRAAAPPATFTPAPIPSGEKPMSAAVERKLDTLLEFMSRGQQAQRAVDAVTKAPPAGQPAYSVFPASEEEALYQRFKTRLLAEIPFGSGGSIVVTPPEKLRKDFQQQEADRIVELVRGIKPLGKRVLKLLEAIEGKPLPQTEINVRLGRSESSRRDMGDACKELAGMGLVASTSNGTGATVRKKIAADLTTYQPTEDEIEAVYQSVLFEIATAE